MVDDIHTVVIFLRGFAAELLFDGKCFFSEKNFTSFGKSMSIWAMLSLLLLLYQSVFVVLCHYQRCKIWLVGVVIGPRGSLNCSSMQKSLM